MLEIFALCLICWLYAVTHILLYVFVADPQAVMFPAQGSDELVLRPSNISPISKKQRRPQGLQHVLPAPEFDAKLRDTGNSSRKQDDHPLSSPVTTPIIDTVEQASSIIRTEENTQHPGRSSITPVASTTLTGTPPPHSEPRLSIAREEDGHHRGLSSPDTHLQQDGNPRISPLNTSTDHTKSTFSLANPNQQTSPVIAHTTDLAPKGFQSTNERNPADCAIWYKDDAHGVDMGENMIFGETPWRVYPIGLSALSRPVWFCPEPNCNRHFGARHRGPEPYLLASALREHAINVHPPRPLPSSSILPAPRIIRDSEVAIDTIREGFTRAESARVGAIPARQTVPRPASVGSIPAEFVSFAVPPKLPQPVLPSPTFNARQREETDSLLGSDDDDPSDDAPAVKTNLNVPSNVPTTEAYISPYTMIPNQAGSIHQLPPVFAKQVQEPPTKTIPQPPPPNRSRAKFGERACLFCHARKAKCGKERPHCGFCIKRGLQCTYPGEGEITSDSYDSHSESTTNVTQETIRRTSASGTEHLNMGMQRPGEEEEEEEDDDDDEEKLLAEIEAMEVPTSLIKSAVATLANLSP